MRYLLLFAAAVPIAAAADFEGLFSGGLNHPAIQYAGRPTRDAVSALSRALQEGKLQLPFDPRHGYLNSILEALRVPVESQMLVFSKTSVQARIINPRNPRALYFNDSVVVGWIRGGDFLELASHDPEQGVIFHTIYQRPMAQPAIIRNNACLGCHESYSSLGVPGMLVRSVFPSPDGFPVRSLGDYNSDHRSPLGQLWGGWYVTGKAGGAKHMGNTLYGNSGSHEAFLSPEIAGASLTPYSDIVALMVFDHQMRMINLLTRVGWEARLNPPEPLLRDAARQLADYLLFVDEPPLPGKIEGSSGFAQKFAAQGPRDRKGRGLRQLDLERRLMRYPLSYMIYSEAFDALPAAVRSATYERLWEILSGKEKGPRYARLPASDRRAIVEILRDTRPGLPDYFQPSISR